jgi:hypothetical protein
MVMSDEDTLKLEDWKMANDRVKYLDDTVMKTRTQGIPIATTIQVAAFTTLGAKIGDITIGQGIIHIFGFSLAVFQLIIGASLAYLVPVLLLDIMHYKLLLRAVDHTKVLESHFKDKLLTTTKLTSSKLTLMHTVGAYLVYAFIFVFGILFSIYGVPKL